VPLQGAVLRVPRLTNAVVDVYCVVMCVGARRADPSRVLLLLLLLLLLLSVSVSMLCDQVGNVKAAGLRLEEAAKDLSAPGEVGSHRSAAGA
jgi:hypothetical protein